MARKKKVEQQTVETAAVVDVAPAAEAPSAPAEVVEEAAEVAAVEVVAKTPPTVEAVDGEALLHTLTEMLASDQPIITMPAGFELTVVDDEAEVKRQAERTQLDEMWRMNGVAELRGIEQALREVLPGIMAHRDVHRPARRGDVVLTTAELIKALEEAGSEWAAVLRRWYRANHRRAGTSIYVQLALAELDEEGVDEPGQEQDEGSADV